MVYVRRDERGQITAIAEHGEDGQIEHLPLDSTEVVEFLSRCEGHERYKLIQSDLQLIRVLEDLIDVLISKNTITITDFPKSVIDKLLARQSIRKRLTGAIGMEFGDDE